MVKSPRQRIVYVVARNRVGRPTLQHKLRAGSASQTACGRDISEWSRAYSRDPIDAILCRLPGCQNH